MTRRFVRWLIVACLLLASLAVSPLPAMAASTGSLYVYKKNGEGARLPDSCFILWTDAGGGTRSSGVQICDAKDSTPNDGKLVFQRLTPGSYILQESRAPAGYQLTLDRSVTIVAGERTQVVVRDPRGGTSVAVRKTSTAGALLGSACFAILADAGGGTLGNWILSGCDWEDGANDGVTNFRGLRRGNYVLIESQAPPGYKPAANRRFSVTGTSGSLQYTMVNERHVASQTVTINKVDPNGNPVVGACFQLSYPIANPNARDGFDVGSYAGYFGCDANDGARDGKVTIYGVAANTYVALETSVPSGYQIAQLTRFTKVAGVAKSLTVVDKIGGSTLTILIEDRDGNSLAGACISIHREVNGQQGEFVHAGCDWGNGSDDGVITIGNLPNGRFMTSEYGIPPGALRAARVLFTLASNSTKTITVRHDLVGQTESADAEPTDEPAASPPPTSTPEPSATATPSPTEEPTHEPTVEPTAEPSVTADPSVPPDPTAEPTVNPTATEGVPEPEPETPGTESNGAGEESPGS